jgi:hypothetical protein
LRKFRATSDAGMPQFDRGAAERAGSGDLDAGGVAGALGAFVGAVVATAEAREALGGFLDWHALTSAARAQQSTALDAYEERSCSMPRG